MSRTKNLSRLYVLSPKDTFNYNGVPYLCILSNQTLAAIVEIESYNMGPEGLTFKFLKESAIVIGNTLFNFPFSRVEDLREEGSTDIIDLEAFKERARALKDYCRVVIDDYRGPSFTKPIENQLIEFNITVGGDK